MFGSDFSSIARKYGGALDCTLQDVFTILHPDGTTAQTNSTREYKLVDRDTQEYDLYHPLNSLRISPRTGKYMDQMSEDEEKIDRQPVVDALKKLLTDI